MRSIRSFTRPALTLVAILLLSACGTASSTGARSSTSASASPTVSTAGSPTSRALPIGRSSMAMAYDEARHDVLLFGGAAGQTVLDDTWTRDATGWAQRQGLTANPPGRQAAAMAYDQLTQQVILFGGLGASGSLDDTWAWDGSAWQQLHPAHSPSKRHASSASFDPLVRGVLLYGGLQEGGSEPLSDTWIWNGTDWTQSPVQSAGGGGQQELAFLTGANLVERLGDCQAEKDNTVYGFDGGSWVPKTTSGTPPPALCAPAIAGDLSHRNVVLFGGKPASGSAAEDTWLYDGNVWSKLSPTQGPPPRQNAAMVYDTDHQVVLMFGGDGLSPGQSGPLNDSWIWDGSKWTSA